MVLILATGFGVSAVDYRQERLNLPGDNLNLYAVMKLFQESETIEGFEKSLNAEDSYINNLDLNGDNYIDYITVTDYVDGLDHTIVLRVAINARENQDVAVITVNKDRHGKVYVQMIGDELLYGKNYIIEPYYNADGTVRETPNPAYTGNARVVNTGTTVVPGATYVEVHAWPVIRYIYMPTYVVWHSPWYWGYYPTYWRPWRAYYWDYYYGYHAHWHHHYYHHYRYANYYRYTHYTDHYYNRHRHYSTTVRTYRDGGRYNQTYSRPDLRSEGSALYAQRHGDPGRSTAQPAVTTGNRTSTAVGSGRNTAQTTKTQPERPVVNNTRTSVPDVGSPANQGRVSTGTGTTGRSTPGGKEVKTTRTDKPSVNNTRSSAPEIGKPANQGRVATGTGTSGRSNPAGKEVKATRTDKPVVNNTRTSAPEIGKPAYQGRVTTGSGTSVRSNPSASEVKSSRTSGPEVGAPRTSRPKAVQQTEKRTSAPAIGNSSTGSSRSSASVSTESKTQSRSSQTVTSGRSSTGSSSRQATVAPAKSSRSAGENSGRNR